MRTVQQSLIAMAENHNISLHSKSR